MTIAARWLLPIDPYMLLRWDAIALGAAAASYQWKPPRSTVLAGCAALVLFTFWLPKPIPPYVYTLTALGSVMVVAGSVEARWLRPGWLRWFGTRSYGLYLWHVWLLRWGRNPLVTVALSCVVAEASFRLVEMPVRKARLRRPVVGLSPRAQVRLLLGRQRA